MVQARVVVCLSQVQVPVLVGLDQVLVQGLESVDPEWGLVGCQPVSQGLVR
jgi:hypothetical protein